MKRSPVMMLAALLLVGLTGCGSSWQKQFSVQSTPAEQVLTQEKITAAYHAAAEAYDWFDLTTMPLDTSDSKQDGDRVYSRVNQSGITSMTELKAYLNTLFTPELADSLLAVSPGHYRDIDGVLYAQSADRGQDIYLQGTHVAAAQKSDTRWDVTVIFYAGFTDSSVPDAPQVTIGYSQSVLDYEKTDAGWRFATFCPSDNLDRNADTVYTFSYDSNAFYHTDFDKYSDFELCCYLLNADGAFAESPFDILTRRFLKDPEHMMEALALVEESPWEHKDSMISGIGYNAVYSFTMGDRIEFETLLKSSTPAQSDAEQAVWDLISTAYQKGAADQKTM